MKENWKTIEDFPAYEVSDLGRIRRAIAGPPAGHGGSNTYVGKIMKQFPRLNGYSQVSPRLNGKNHTRLVHRLVAKAFVPNPLNLPEVNHKKGMSNAASNLEWRTKQGNMQHAVQNGLTCGDGVYADKRTGRWIARYCPETNKVKHIGVFDTYVAAKAARDAAVSTLEANL